MAIAETAQLITQLSLQDNLTPGLARARGQLSGFSTVSGGASSALNTFKGRIGGLLGATGLIGLGAGLFSVEQLMKGSIQEAQDFGAEVFKLQAVTGLSAQKTSELAGAFHHFGIEATQAQRLMGFLEKNVGNLSVNTKAETKFTEDFGFSLRNTSITVKQLAAAQSELGDKTISLGQKVKDVALIHKYFGSQIKDANQLILEAADYFNNKAIPAQIKAAALAKLFGRSWQDLIPILKAGRAGIQGAEEEAAKLGLTLTGSNLTALAKLREATRSWGTALGGLKLQIGLALVPALTELANAATNFLAHGGREQIVGFFKQLIAFGREAASVVTGQVIPVFKGIYSAWMAVPKEVRDLLITGLVANKTIKFLFGVSPLDLGKSLLGGIGGQFFARGASPANPMWVATTGGFGEGGGAGGTPFALGAPGLATLVAGIALPLIMFDLIPKLFPGGAAPAGSIQNPNTTSFVDRTGTTNVTGAYTGYLAAAIPGLTVAVDKNTAAVKTATPVGAGLANLAHGYGMLKVPGSAITQSHPVATMTAAQFIAALNRSAFIGAAGYKSIFERFTTFRGGGRGTDPTGQGFLAIVEQLKNPKVPAVMLEIKGHLKELQSLEAYYIAHGDIKNALKVQGVINEVDKLIGVTRQDHAATSAAAIRTGQTLRALHQVSSAGFRAMASEENRTASNTAIVARKNFSPHIGVSAQVNVASTNTFNVNSLATSLVSTYTRVNVGNQYQGKVVPL